jgi:hypothetical protein
MPTKFGAQGEETGAVIPSAQVAEPRLDPPKLTRDDVNEALRRSVSSAQEMDVKLRGVFELSSESISFRLR